MEYQTDMAPPTKRTGNFVEVGVMWVAAMRLKSFRYPDAEMKQIEMSPINSGFNYPCAEGNMIFSSNICWILLLVCVKVWVSLHENWFWMFATCSLIECGS